MQRRDDDGNRHAAALTVLLRRAKRHPHPWARFGRTRRTRPPPPPSENANAPLFARQPTKATLRLALTQYTHTSDRVAAARRGVDPHPARVTLQTDYAVAAYMRRFALRTPAMPVKARDPMNATYQRRPRYLYRGVPFAFPAATVLDDKSYMSWSTNLHLAASYGDDFNGHARVLRLDIAALPRGVPWVWFSSEEAAARDGWDVGALRDAEDEVLLPPGRLTPLSPFVLRKNAAAAAAAGTEKNEKIGMFGGQRVYIVDVAYEPDRAARPLWPRATATIV